MRYAHGGRCPAGLVDYSANINPYGLPESVKKALIENIDSLSRYPDPDCTELKASLAARHRGHIVCGNGAAELIFSLTRALAVKTAVLLSPGFHEYERALSGAEIRYVELSEKKGFRWDGELFAALEGADFFIFSNPQNPTGVLEDPRPVFEFCRKRGIFVCADECFMDFCDLPRSAEPLLYERSAIIRAFTKTHAMAGLRLGYLVTPDRDLAERIEQARPEWTVSKAAQLAGLAAMRDGEYLCRTLPLIAKEREKMRDFLCECGCRVYGSRANFLFFRARPGLFEHCRRNGFIIRDCSNYRGLEEGFYRIAVGRDNERLLEVIRQWQSR